MNYVYLTILVFFIFLRGIAQEEIIVKFNYSYLDYEFIDDESRKTAKLNELFNEEAAREIYQLSSKFPELLESNVRRICY